MEQNTASNEAGDFVVRLLSEASCLTNDPEKKVEILRKVENLIVYEDPSLLDNFLDEIIGFQSDECVEVRCFVAHFLQVACRSDPEIIFKIVANIGLLLDDKNVNVVKRAIIAATEIHQLVFKWVARSKIVSETMEQTWHFFMHIKTRLLTLMESENDGVRTHAIRFLESVILLQSVAKTKEIEEADAVSLDQIPRDHKFISYRKLEAEGRTLFQRLLDLSASSSVSSINLIACMNALTSIAKRRNEYFEKVVLALEALHVNLPPTLAKSQVSSVRKELKKHLFSLIKLPVGLEFMHQIGTLLADLGASHSELRKYLPVDEVKKRRKDALGADDELESEPKKSKAMEDEDVEYGQDEDNDGESGAAKPKATVDVSAEFVRGRLTIDNVTSLVLVSMASLPDVMPAQFQSSYTPIAAAGTDTQVRHLSRLIAAQLSARGVGFSVDEQQGLLTKKSDTSFRLNDVETDAQWKADDANSAKTKLNVVVPAGTAAVKVSKQLQQFGLLHITKPLDSQAIAALYSMAFDRISSAERCAAQGGSQTLHSKILVSMATQFTLPALPNMLETFIVGDKSRIDMAVSWLYQEYAAYQGFNNSVLQDEQTAFEKYDQCLTRLLTAVAGKGDYKESMFHRLLLEAPLITPRALDILKQSCTNSVHGGFCLETLQQLVINRPKQRRMHAAEDYLTSGCGCEYFRSTRTRALELAKDLYLNEFCRQTVSEYMTKLLRTLSNPAPPSSLFGIDRGRPVNTGKWEDDCIRACLYLFLKLLPVDHKLIHELARVYVETPGDIKRVILRQLEAPILKLGMYSSELLSLVETCPKGAETLVTRIVHLLTEKGPPSQDLVKRIRELYQKRVPDVRFLIPVLTGLTKKEIIGALPKLVKLNPNIVKEVFNRLLHNQGLPDAGDKTITPAELMVALHNFDVSHDNMKSIIAAMNLLFAEKQIYTQEVLAGVIQQLTDQNPLPLLLMRTVIQALNLFPRLIGFVMNILLRLIVKQVWKQPKVWEGFVKCCHRTKPQSFQVLLQLPPPQLKSIFVLCPELRQPLLEHINSLSSNQQAHISQSVLKTLQTDPAEYNSAPLEPSASAEAASESSPQPHDGGNLYLEDGAMDLSLQLTDSMEVADAPEETPSQPPETETS